LLQNHFQALQKFVQFLQPLSGILFYPSQK
jgi:hypothetical protein